MGYYGVAAFPQAVFAVLVEEAWTEGFNGNQLGAEVWQLRLWPHDAFSTRTQELTGQITE